MSGDTVVISVSTASRDDATHVPLSWGWRVRVTGLVPFGKVPLSSPTATNVTPTPAVSVRSPTALGKGRGSGGGGGGGSSSGGEPHAEIEIDTPVPQAVGGKLEDMWGQMPHVLGLFSKITSQAGFQCVRSPPHRR